MCWFHHWDIVELEKSESDSCDNRLGPVQCHQHGLDIFSDVMVEVLPYCTPMNELHVLEVEKVYWKYILNVLIDSIMKHLKETISIFPGPTVSWMRSHKLMASGVLEIMKNWEKKKNINTHCQVISLDIFSYQLKRREGEEQVEICYIKKPLMICSIHWRQSGKKNYHIYWMSLHTSWGWKGAELY